MRISRETEELRGEIRVPASLPVSIDDRDCITRDISATAVFLESSAPFEEGERVDFSIGFDSPGGKLILKCSGKVVRIEKRDGKIGAAIKIIESAMESAQG